MASAAASVAPLVNTTSAGRAPIAAGDLAARAVEEVARGAPRRVDGARVPEDLERRRAPRRSPRGRMGVMALWSR